MNSSLPDSTSQTTNEIRLYSDVTIDSTEIINCVYNKEDNHIVFNNINSARGIIKNNGFGKTTTQSDLQPALLAPKWPPRLDPKGRPRKVAPNRKNIKKLQLLYMLIRFYLLYDDPIKRKQFKT